MKLDMGKITIASKMLNEAIAESQGIIGVYEEGSRVFGDRRLVIQMTEEAHRWAFKRAELQNWPGTWRYRREVEQNGVLFFCLTNQTDMEAAV